MASGSVWAGFSGAGGCRVDPATEEPMEQPASLRRGRKCARRSTASLGLTPA